jgi:glycosyltransferase involved in cell wall biosynthesis
MNRCRILFILHSATRSGAPIVMLHFFKVLREKKIKFDILLREDGPLVNEFRRLAPLRIWHRRGYSGIIGKMRKLFLIAWLLLWNYRLIYVNSAACSDITLVISRFLKCPILFHVHEMKVALKTYCNLDKVKDCFRKVSHFIAVSSSVRSMLIEDFGIRNEDISIVHSFSVPSQPISEIARAQSGIPENAFVVGGCGTALWIKGIDLYFETARLCIEKQDDGRPLFFVWLGIPENSFVWHQVKNDIEKMNLSDSVKLFNPCGYPLSVFGLFDLFFLSSREDSFPLVALENGACGIPVICFEQAGGATEYIDNSCGAVVPYMDTGAACDAILAFYHDEKRRHEAGIELQHRVRSYDADAGSEAIYRIISRMLLEKLGSENRCTRKRWMKRGIVLLPSLKKATMHAQE